MTQIRLDKFLSNAGCGTRTEVKQQLKKGLVTVNGSPVARGDFKLDPAADRVLWKHQEICLNQNRYYMLNKPAGYLSATEDKRQPVVLDLLRELRKEDLFPVGRLDIDTEGLLLLTNDGALAHELLSPRKHVDKTYYARVEGLVTEEDVQRFWAGLEIGEKNPTLPARLEILEAGEISRVRVTIQEGKFHQIKRMFETVGKQVIYLQRLSMGSLRLDPELKKGEYRSLTREEIEGLKKHAETEKSSHI